MDYLERTNGGTSFQGSDMDIYNVLVLASGLSLYAQTGMKPNRAWTPSAMLAKASEITKKKYKRGQYAEAANDLINLANELKKQPRTAKARF